MKTRDDKNLSATTLRRFAAEMMAGQAANKAPSPYLAAIVEQAERAAALLERPGKTAQLPYGL
ncbi:hypothetical protein [Stagnihabitans tardus]|uniref:Uncharacterized protein n=1 Tax=Stagnihabitans tardus TaxID=2699202 RepID=A0AAE4YDL9_9RHOB|nr:hypothetical protein [Stagnihabitans tardus]NBZ90144.1 hypothetical protein [Stagnihabitans tardus]